MSKRKLLAIIISVVMIFSSLSIAVSAEDVFEADYEIRYGETITVSVSPIESDQYVYVKFVPEKDGSFRLSSDSEDSDPYCDLYDATGEWLECADDGYDTWNFELNYSFTAGETYYFALADYSCGSTWKITLSCAHEYDENGYCIYCQDECPHDTSGSLIPVCDCGKVYDGKDIKAGDELNISVSDEDSSYVLLRFIPDESGTYLMKSVDAQTDPYCDLYDSYGEWVSGNDDSSLEAVGYNFTFAYHFEAGETYYFYLSDFEDIAEYKIVFDKATHEAEDGIHNLEYTEEVHGSCIEPYYTEGLYCPVCDEYIYGHEEYIDYSHVDDDWDSVCDVCGAEIWYGYEDDIFDDAYESLTNVDLIGIIRMIVDALEHLKEIVFDILGMIVLSFKQIC